MTISNSSDPNRPDYVCPAYREMEPRWRLVEDVRGGTDEIRAKKETYLPKFDAESLSEWAARVLMTFAKDHYAITLEEHVGLVLATPPKLSDDVPEVLQELAEDIDGEGNHLEVFAETALDTALHLGHCVLYTDYPDASALRDLNDQRKAKVRPYVTLYRASDVLSWRTAAVGGVKILAQIKFRESSTTEDGEFGVRDSVSYREVLQEVGYDEVTGRATSLGEITWRTWRETKGADGKIEIAEADSGVVVGPKLIPARVVYGGRKLGYLHTKPHLYGLAQTSVEEVQVSSDYATVMHKCNVPTPIFIGRDTSGAPGQSTVRMGQGIDIPTGGDAKMLEPAGTAIEATRQRLQDLAEHMQRQGATSANDSGRTMTATEAAMIAKTRDAKLKRAARSLQDALEGVLQDMAAFLNLPDGGSVTLNQSFTGQTIDPQYLAVLVQAFVAGAFPLEALLYALKEGRLPDEFSAEDEAFRLMSAEIARQEAAEQEAKRVAEAEKNKPPVDDPELRNAA